MSAYMAHEEAVIERYIREARAHDERCVKRGAKIRGGPDKGQPYLPDSDSRLQSKAKVVVLSGIWLKLYAGDEDVPLGCLVSRLIRYLTDDQLAEFVEQQEEELAEDPRRVQAVAALSSSF